MSNQHVLKIHPAPLADLLSGAKTAEVRRNDRGFQVGDTVRLMEVNPETGNWTGAGDLVRTISHIQTGYGLPDGVCVLSYVQPFVPRNRKAGRLAIRAALPDVPGDMLDHGLFAALDAMGAQGEQQEAQSPMAEIAEGLRQKAADEWASHPSNPANQEAQGAQAGDERAAFEEWAHKNWPGAERKMLERNAQGAYKNSIYRDYFTGWQARAALATQPAVQWLSMETAPKDCRILVLRVIHPQTGSCEAAIAQWNAQPYHAKPNPYWEIERDGLDIRTMRDRPPLGWMPLPRPAAVRGAGHE